MKQRYAWPASRLGRDEMTLLFRAREQADDRTTIARLVAEAVKQTYGEAAGPTKRQEAA